MAKVSEEHQHKPLRALIVGNSGAGKTGGLISLLRAGYNIRMLDMDNNSDSLIELCKREDKKLLEHLDIISIRDKFRASQTTGIEVAGQPKAFVNMLGFLNKWDDGSVPAEWDQKNILAIDTLNSVGRAAFLWAKGMNPTSKDPRQWYGAAQEAITGLLEMVTAKEFKPHVLVLSHIKLVEMPDGFVKGFPTSIGKALGPETAKTFSNLFVVESKGSGDKQRRTIGTVPTQLLDLKNAKPWELEATYPIDTGLATIFEKLLA